MDGPRTTQDSQGIGSRPALSRPAESRAGAGEESSALELAAYLGPATCILGTLSLSGNVRFDGTLEGELLGALRVIVGPTGRVRGRIHADHVIVLGATVEARIEAAHSIELRHGAVVKGDLTAPHIHMDPDIEFHGRCDLNPRSLPPGPGAGEPGEGQTDPSRPQSTTAAST